MNNGKKQAKITINIAGINADSITVTGKLTSRTGKVNNVPEGANCTIATVVLGGVNMTKKFEQGGDNRGIYNADNNPPNSTPGTSSSLGTGSSSSPISESDSEDSDWSSDFDIGSTPNTHHAPTNAQTVQTQSSSQSTPLPDTTSSISQNSPPDLHLDMSNITVAQGINSVIGHPTNENLIFGSGYINMQEIGLPENQGSMQVVGMTGKSVKFTGNFTLDM